MTERFSIRKLLDFSPLGWYKLIGLGIKLIIGIILVLGLIAGVQGILHKFFPPAPANVNQPNISVEEGGTANYTVIQQSEKKRAWWMPSPFVEIFSQHDSDGDSGVGTRFGGRWDF